MTDTIQSSIQVASGSMTSKLHNRHVALALCLSMVGLQLFMQYSAVALVGEWMKVFNLSAGMAGFLCSSYFYVYVLLQVPAGYLLDRYGVKDVLMVGAVVTMIGAVVLASAHSLWVAWVGRFLLGAGSSCAFVAALKVAAENYSARWFPLMVAMVETLAMLGAIGAQNILVRVLGVGHWRLMLWLVAGFLIIWLVLAQRYLSSDRRHARRWCQQSFNNMVQQPICWLNGLYCGLTYSVVTVFAGLWMTNLLVNHEDFSVIDGTMVGSYMLLGVSIGAPLVGWIWSNFVRARRPLLIYAPIVGALLLYGFLDGHLYHLTQVGAYCWLATIVGLLASTYMLNFSIARDIAAPSQIGVHLGWVNMFSAVTAPVFQPMFGWIVSQHEISSGSIVLAYDHAVDFMVLTQLVAGYVGYKLYNHYLRAKIL